MVSFSDFFIASTWLIFTKLRQVFVKALILYYFDLKHYIRLETNTSGYAIGKVLNQLILNNSSQWHLMVFLS